MDNLFLGAKVREFLPGLEAMPITKVELLNENGDIVGEAGNDSGRTLTATHPDGTDAMAKSILSKVNGFIYRPYDCVDALIDPAAEVGDGITVEGVYSVLAQTDILFDGLYTANISAPTTDEIEDEYPYKSPVERMVQRKIAQTQSLITKTAEEIRLEVQNEVEGLSSSVTVQLDSITATVQGQNGKISQMQQTVDSISTSVSGYDGRISKVEQTATSLTSTITDVNGKVSKVEQTMDGVMFQNDQGTTVINGNYITTGSINADLITTGQLNIDRVRLYGKLRIYEDEKQENYGGYVGFYEGEDADGETTYGIELYKNLNSVVLTDGGVRLRSRASGTTEIVVTENINLDAHGNIWLTGDNIYSSTSISNVSDRRKKERIQYDAERYLPILDALVPASFFHTEHSCNKRHLGFIAQEVEEAMLAAGIRHDEFAALSIREDGYYGLCYEEFIPLLVAKVQQLDAKMKELTA